MLLTIITSLMSSKLSELWKTPSRSQKMFRRTTTLSFGQAAVLSNQSPARSKSKATANSDNESSTKSPATDYDTGSNYDLYPSIENPISEKDLSAKDSELDKGAMA